MLFLFYCIVFFLVLFAFAFLWPALGTKKYKIIVFCFLLCTVSSLTLLFGASQQLKDYYSAKSQKLRKDHDKIRPLFSELKKQQGRLRLVLLENPDDNLAKALLLELMAIESLYRQDKKLALSFFDAALKMLPQNTETVFIRNRINHLKGLVTQTA